VRIGVLSDLHLSVPGTPDGRWINPQPLGRSADLLDEALGQLARAGVDAVLLLGDLAEHGSPREFGMLRARIPGVTAPIWAVAGNHDLTELDDPLDHADVQSPGVPGQCRGPVHIAAGMLRRTGRGEFTDELPPFTWPAGQAVVWLSHFPVLPTRQILAEAELPHAGDLTNRAQVAGALSGHPGPVVVLAGHLHVHLAVSAGNILQLDHPALVEWPHGLAILDIANTSRGLEVRWSVQHLAPKSADVSVNTMLADADERWCWHADEWSRLEGGSKR
jgi:DNA repair exonuclease SbcCD nuclease subunit